VQITGKNLGLVFGRTKVFEKLDFEADNGLWLIKGSNGTGKTSLCKIICGLLKPSNGHIKWHCDKSMDRHYLLGKVGFSTPEMGLYEELTIEENIKFFENIAHSKIDDTFGLSKQKGKLYRELSSGWKQRMKILVAFLGNPLLLVLDEPEQHLDEQGLTTLTEMISKRQDLTIISTNNPWMDLPVLVELGKR
jgi:ABC-type multidrug transport system ATPase subunit